jgi:biopolymer transport protein ExbD
MEINSDVPVFKLSSIDEKNKKTMTVKIKYRNQFIEVINDSNGSKIFEFKGEVDSVASELHQFLIKLKLEYPQEEKAILQIDEQVVYEDLVKIMDSVRQQRITKKVAPLFPRLMFF